MTNYANDERGDVRVVVDPNRTVRRMTDDMKDYVELPVRVYEITLDGGNVVRICEPYDDDTLSVELDIKETQAVSVNHGRGASDTCWQLEIGAVNYATKDEAIFGGYELR